MRTHAHTYQAKVTLIHAGRCCVCKRVPGSSYKAGKYGKDLAKLLRCTYTFTQLLVNIFRLYTCSALINGQLL